ncbi:MAG: histidinol-phosphatase [Campylobacterota bacterium]
MRVDLHNHTTLCNHAVGSVDEYINKAIEKKIDVFGFSEHAPMSFDEKYRMPFNTIEFYETTLKYYKEIYKDKIELLMGYEVDFMQTVCMHEEILKADVDYLIGSVHFLESKNNSGDSKTPWGFDNPEFIGEYKSKNIDQIWKDYFDAIFLLAKSGKFDIVGHLDLIKVFKYMPRGDIKLIAQDALKQIKKSNMIIEINAAGIRKPINEPYPSKQLLELAYELGIDITFSCDAHSIEQVGYGYEQAINLAKEVGYEKCALFRKRDKQLVRF